MQQVSVTAPAMFGADPFRIAVTVFALTYVLVIADRINRSIIALLGAGVMVVSGVLSQDEAIRGIDFNTIALLTGMMVLVAIARRCGIFEFLAVWSAKNGRAQPWAILAMLALVTAIVSRQRDHGPPGRAGDDRDRPLSRSPALPLSVRRGIRREYRRHGNPDRRPA